MKKVVITLTLFFAPLLVALINNVLCVSNSTNQGSIKAQTNLDSMIIISVGEYKPTIMESNKISENPVITDSTKKLSVTASSITSRKINTGFDVEPIKAAQMVGEPLTKLYNTLVKLGMGTYTTPYGEVWVNSLRSKTGTYGVRLKHLSSSTTLKNYGYAGYSDNEVSLHGKKFLKEHSLIGNFDYSRNVVHFYGYDPSVIDLTNDQTKQRFNYFVGSAQLLSHYTESSKINHDVKLSYYNLSDKFGSSENNIKANGVIQKNLTKELVKVNASVDYYNYKTTKDTVNNTIITINPNFIAKGEKYHVNLGLTAVADAFFQTKFYFYPNVDASYNVIDNIIVPYAGINGGLEKNSFKSFSDKNPFVLSNLQMNNTNKKYECYGGIKGSLSSTTSFNARASYSSLNNLALFVNDTLEPFKNKFNVIYDNATLINVRGELAYQQREKLRISLRGEYFSYKMQHELRAWYIPQVQVTLSGNYNLQDKIVIKADLFYLDNQFSKTFVSDTLSVTGKSIAAKQLKGIFDANIGVEYRYTKKLGFFLNMSNIANYRYYRWSNYPTQRFSLMGGLSYSF